MIVRSLRTLLGLQYDDLWQRTPEERRQRQVEQLGHRLRRSYGRLVRRRRRIEKLRQRLENGSTDDANSGAHLDRARLERQEFLYQADLAEVRRLRERLIPLKKRN